LLAGDADMSESTRRAVVLGGCNGAGKTTASRALLADTLGVLNFVNADQIAQGLSGFDPESMTVEASRIMLERLRELARQGQSFAFESTLAGRTYSRFLLDLRQAGYRIEVYYFWLASVDLSIQRVAARVASGGHDVPEPTLRQRYPRSVQNFLSLYRPLADLWEVYDNSESGNPVLVATGERDLVPDVIDLPRWAAIERSRP
jgi:predicted ABC-type ATPase